jgi:hypothetical protein
MHATPEIPVSVPRTPHAPREGLRHAERDEYENRCPKFLDLLAEFYGEMAAPPAIDAMMVAPDAIPQPQQSLLVHDRDMTSTLARFHGEPIELRVLDCKLTRDHYRRHIVLETAHSRRPAEYGAIRVNLPLLTETARTEVLQARGPLGGILTAHGITFRCCPGAYFKILSNELINESLRLDEAKWLYGRCNCLSDAGGRTMAEVIEILPPWNKPEARSTKYETNPKDQRDE